MKKYFAFIIALCIAFALCACGAENAESADKNSGEVKSGEGITVGVVYKQSDNEYFRICEKGFQNAADELGFELISDGPEDGTVDGQESIIRSYIDRKVDVICVSANDASALVDICNEARDAGIKVISWDSNIDTAGRDLDIEPASAELIGLTQLEFIAEQMGYNGQLAIVSANETSPNQNLWIASIEEALGADSKYADIDYIGVVYGKDDYDKSYEVTEDLIKRYPDLKGIIAPTSIGAPAAAKCIMDEGKESSIKVTGLTLSREMAEYIHNGVAPATFLWNPVELGYVSAYAAVAAVKGDLKIEPGACLEVPGFEKLTVEASNDGGYNIILNKLYKFDDTNVDDWIADFEK